MELDKTKIVYEDQLPEDMTDEQYDLWFKHSWVDGVRIGYGLVENQHPDVRKLVGENNKGGNK